MRKFVGLILLVTLVFLSSIAVGFDPATMNPQSQTHNAHIGPGTAGLNCDACHGFPANVVQVQNGSKPGEYVVCESCHAPPPDSFKPSFGNLVTIHLSRNTYCTNCHDADNISPTHPPTKAENGTLQVIKCENCHANPQQFTSHADGGKYCLNCHGDKTTTYVVPTRTPLTISVSPTRTPLTIPVSTYAASTVKVRIIIDSQRGFVPVVQTIKAGDEIVWKNDGRVTVTLVSSDGLFDNQLLTFDKEYRYTFNKPGTYSFYLNENKDLKGTVTVSGAVSSSASPVSTPVSTYAAPTVKQRAQLQVTYEVGAGRTGQELTVSVSLKNVGNGTASKINLTVDNPPELQAIVLSGSEKIGETIAWKGELKPGEEHVARYAVKAITGKNIEIPLKVTYARVSPDEKAKALGILSTNAEQLLAPEDWDTILMVIKIAATAVPGFEAIVAIAMLLSVGVILRHRKGS